MTEEERKAHRDTNPGDGERILREAFQLIRQSRSNQIVKELCETQPIGNEFFPDFMSYVKSEEWLIENGYEPIDPPKLNYYG